MIILRLLISFSQSGITLAHEIAAFVIIGLYAVGSVYMVAVTFKVLVGYFSSVDN
jgi:hypothetical protein